MATSTDTQGTDKGFYSSDDHRRTYKSLMNFGFGVGFPVGGAIALFVALLLMDAGIIVSLILSVLGWLGLYAIAKSFFVH